MNNPCALFEPDDTSKKALSKEKARDARDRLNSRIRLRVACTEAAALIRDCCSFHSRKKPEEFLPRLAAAFKVARAC